MNDLRYINFYCEPKSEEYKGYRLAGEIAYYSHGVRMTFSNRQKSFQVSSETKEKAFSCAFDIIDMEP